MLPSHIQHLLEFQSEMNNQFFLTSMLRSILWGVIKLFDELSKVLDTILNGAYALLDFLSSDELLKFFSRYRSVFFAVLMFSIAAYVLTLFTNPVEKTKRFFQNILVCIMVVAAMPFFIESTTNMASGFIKQEQKENQDISKDIILSNITDLYKVDEANFDRKSFDRLEKKNSIPRDNLSLIDINELIDKPNEMKNSKEFSKKAHIDKNGKIVEQDLDAGFLKFWLFSNYYYRYKVDMLPILISLGAYDVGKIFMSVKIIIFIFGLAVARVLALAFSHDLSNGSRLKAAFELFWQTLAVLCATTMLTRLYGIFIVYIMSKASGISAAIYILGATYVYLDGPNEIEKVLGVDAGLKSGLRTMAGAMMAWRATKGAVDALGTVAKTGGKVLMGAGMVGAYQAGKGRGLFDKFSEAQSKNGENNGIDLKDPEKDPTQKKLKSGQEELPNTDKTKLGHGGDDKQTRADKPGSSPTSSNKQKSETLEDKKNGMAEKNKDPTQSTDRGKEKSKDPEASKMPPMFEDKTLSDLAKDKVSKNKVGSKLKDAYNVGRNTGMANFDKYNNAYGKYQPIAKLKSQQIQSTIGNMFKQKPSDYKTIQKYSKDDTQERGK